MPFLSVLEQSEAQTFLFGIWTEVTNFIFLDLHINKMSELSVVIGWKLQLLLLHH